MHIAFTRLPECCDLDMRFINDGKNRPVLNAGINGSNSVLGAAGFYLRRLEIRC
jgi:hypothetical protein